MIPNNIQTENLLSAIEILRGKRPTEIQVLSEFELYFLGDRLSPGAVISEAHHLISGKHLRPDELGTDQEINDFLIERGFPIARSKKQDHDGFFTIEEIRFFQKYVIDRAYDSQNPIHQNAGEFIREFLWAKSAHWAKALEKELPGMNCEGKISWNQVDKVHGQRFKEYTWYRLFQVDLGFKKVFFTIGVDGRPGALLYKLDCMDEHQGEALSPFQVEVFREALKARGIEDQYISSTDCVGYTWEKLIQKSKKFIQENLDNYREIAQLVDQARPGRYARICWNTNGWKAPSGREGKSRSSAPTYEKEHGYGHDEWLLDLDKTIDGYHYSRIQGARSKNEKHPNGTFNLCLYTHDWDNKQWYWCGWINNAEVISPQVSEAIAQIYEQNGWYEGQLVQLKNLKSDYNNHENWPKDDLFNIRFKPENADIFTPMPFRTNEKPPTTHYNMSDITVQGALSSFTSILKEGNEIIGTDGSINEKSYFRNFSEKTTENENIHGKIQKLLYNYLKLQFPDDKINTEGSIKFGRRIDVFRQLRSGEYVFYEVKSYPNVLTSLRVAIGQLLEYCLYPDALLAEKVFIATHKDLTPKDHQYLHSLNQRLNGIKIGYIYVNLEKEEMKVYEQP